MKKTLLFFIPVITYLIIPSTLLIYPQQTDSATMSGTVTDPGVSVAACKSITDISSIANCGVILMQIAIYFLIALAMLYTLYCAFMFIKEDGEGKTEWRGAMIRGLIALFIMVSVWGIITILTNTFGFSNNAPITVPTFAPTTQSTQ